eukprot:TRINITY_DN4573_c0_g1_i3.p1 TRINITY_DN4573_c0_g1~~TRINITY_DN4573_c0_g1_i3.p1  ORF type:complete len:1186 (+),score=275.14 TRINITY_DN4573_c0_g1_i3:199-3756(+)
MDCLTLEVNQLRGLKDPPAQQGGRLPLDTPISVVCRAARSPVTPEAGRASACMTEFQPLTCSRPLPYAGKNMFFPEKLRFSGASACQSGYQVNAVQCEVRYFFSPERKGSLGVFRVTPADMSLAGRKEFISVPMFRHRIAPWPTFQWLYGSPAGTAVVRLGCGDEKDRTCFSNFRGVAVPYRHRDVRQTEARYKKSLFNWQRERPFPVRFGVMSPLTHAGGRNAHFLNSPSNANPQSMNPLNLDDVRAKRWSPGDTVDVTWSGASTESGPVNTDGATATTSATDDAEADDDDTPSGRDVLMQLTRHNQRKAAGYRKSIKGEGDNDTQSALSDNDVLTSSRARWGGKEEESTVFKLAKKQQEAMKKYDLGNVPPEVDLPLFDRLQQAYSWADHMRVTSEQAKVMGRFTWTDHGGCPLIFSHRAVLNSDDVENTLDAALKSATAGVDGLEIDVFMTGSYEYGGYVATMLHDVNLDRLIGYAQSVANWNYYTLQRMNQIKARLSQCDLFPTLSDLLKLCHALDLKLNIELKPGEPDFIVKTFPDYAAKLGHEVGRLIRKHRVGSHVVVSSFDPAKLRYVNEDFPGTPSVRTVAATYKTFKSSLLTKFGKWFGKMEVHGECVHYSLATPSLVKKYHAKKQPVGVYTIYDLAEPKTGDSFKDETIKALIDMKVDWIETDDPVRLQKTLVRLGCRSTRPYDKLARTRRDIIGQAQNWRYTSLQKMKESDYDSNYDPKNLHSSSLKPKTIAAHLGLAQYSVSAELSRIAAVSTRRTHKNAKYYSTAQAMLYGSPMRYSAKVVKLDLTKLKNDGFHVVSNNWQVAPNKIPIKTLQLTPDSMVMIPLHFRVSQRGENYRFFLGQMGIHDLNSLLNPELHLPLAPLYNDAFAAKTPEGKGTVMVWIRPHCPKTNHAAMGLFNFRPAVVSGDWRKLITAHNRDEEAVIKLPLRQDDLNRAMLLSIKHTKMVIPAAHQICLVVHANKAVNIVGRVARNRQKGKYAGRGVALVSKLTGQSWISTKHADEAAEKSGDKGITVEDAILGQHARACEGEMKKDCVCTGPERCQNAKRAPFYDKDLCALNAACIPVAAKCLKVNGICSTARECASRGSSAPGLKGVAAFIPGLCPGSEAIICCTHNPPETHRSEVKTKTVFLGYDLQAPGVRYLKSTARTNVMSTIMRPEDYQVCDDAGNCL